MPSAESRCSHPLSIALKAGTYTLLMSSSAALSSPWPTLPSMSSLVKQISCHTMQHCVTLIFISILMKLYIYTSTSSRWTEYLKQEGDHGKFYTQKSTETVGGLTLSLRQIQAQSPQVNITHMCWKRRRPQENLHTKVLKPKKTQGKFYTQKYWNRRRPQANLTSKSTEAGEDSRQIQHTKQLKLGIRPPGKFKTKKYWDKMVGLWKAKLQILHTKVLKQKTPGKFYSQNLSKVRKQKAFWLLLQVQY